MTLPTSRLGTRLEVRFPYEFTQQYDMPPAFFGGGVAIGGKKMSVGALGGWPADDGIATENDLFHKNHRAEALQQVRGSIIARENSRLRQLVGLAPSYNLMAGGCDSCGGSMLTGVGTIEGAPVLAGSGGKMVGGVMRTLAGRQYVTSRLTKRIDEHNAVDAATFEENPWSKREEQQPLSETGRVVVELGEHLAALSDAMTSGVFDKDTTSEAKDIVNTLVQSGWAIPQNQITMIMRQVIGALSEFQAYVSSPKLSAKDKNIIRLIFVLLERARELLKVLTKASSLSPVERKQALEAYSAVITSQSAEAQRRTRVRGRTGARFGERVAPIEEQDTRQVFPVPREGYRLPEPEIMEELMSRPGMVFDY